MRPETAARNKIDDLLAQSGWVLQDYGDHNIGLGQGISVREFPLKRGYGAADYVLYVDRAVVGVVEAKQVGQTLTGVEVQTEE